MACHICKRTGIRTCNQDDADTQCEICGFCRAEDQRKEREKVVKEVFK